MSIFSKFGKWVGKNAKTVATVALPVVGFAAGLVAPSVGAAIGKLADGLGNKVKEVTGIGDGKPGVFGIGDGLPGVFGIGTGAAALEKLKNSVPPEVIEAIKVKLKGGEPLTPLEKEQVAKAQAAGDMKKEGINPLFLIGGGLLAFLALGGSSSRR